MDFRESLHWFLMGRSNDSDIHDTGKNWQTNQDDPIWSGAVVYNNPYGFEPTFPDNPDSMTPEPRLS